MIHYEDRGPVAVLTIDRAARRNALDHEALEQLLEAHDRAVEAKVVVLTGAGGHFCATTRARCSPPSTARPSAPARSWRSRATSG